MNGSGEFERHLERELHRILDPIGAAPIPPRRTLASRGVTRRLLGGAGAALGVKGVAATGSHNPATWGHQVHQTVQTCKDTLRASGTRGIGPCVSAIASQRGQQASEGNKSTQGDGKVNDGKSNAKDKGEGNGNGNGTGNGKSNGNGNGNGHGNGNGNGNAAGSGGGGASSGG